MKIENSNYYVVGQQIYSDKDKPIKYWLDKDGYYRCSIKFNNGKRKFLGVHKVILFTYLNISLDERLITHHINGVKTDNRIVNLRLTDAKGNTNFHYNRYVKAVFETGGEYIFESIEECSKILRMSKETIMRGKTKGVKFEFEPRAKQIMVQNDDCILRYLNKYKKIYLYDGHIFYTTREIDSYLGLGEGLSKYYIRQYGKIRGKGVI